MQFFEHTRRGWSTRSIPRYLLPRAAGVDISDSSIKWVTLKESEEGLRIDRFGETAISPGIVEGGSVRSPKELSARLAALKHEFGGVQCAHAALPEEEGYVFSMHVPQDTPRDQILSMIEFEFEGRIPVAPADAVYDYDIINTHEKEHTIEIGVAVFPREVAESYAQVFAQAGIQLLSLEIEARSIARAVAGDSPEGPITLLVDFGRARTGFAVLHHDVPIFTSTVDVGGDIVTQAVMKTLNVNEHEAEIFKNYEGLVPEEGSRSTKAEAVVAPTSALVDEIVRHYRFWDTRRDEHGERVTPVERIILVGGSANLKGLPEYIAARVQARVERAHVWRHLAPFHSYIPPIDERTSLEYATALGLALRSFASV